MERPKGRLLGWVKPAQSGRAGRHDGGLVPHSSMYSVIHWDATWRFDKSGSENQVHGPLFGPSKDRHHEDISGGGSEEKTLSAPAG
jgi:hypothetical protein